MTATLTCNHSIAKDLEKKGYVCQEIYWYCGQKHYVFVRDPWEPAITLAFGELSTKFQDYCRDGNVGQ